VFLILSFSSFSSSITVNLLIITGTIPTSLMSWGMIGELSMSATESLVLFGAVAGAMDLFLRWKLIRPFPSEK
jgi:hypothetical protein